MPHEKSGQIPELVKSLKSIRICELTLMSQKLLSLPEDEQQVLHTIYLTLNHLFPNIIVFVYFTQDFIAKNADKELLRLPTIVAMDTIRRNLSSSSMISYLIIASESGEIVILDTQSFTVLQHVNRK